MLSTEDELDDDDDDDELDDDEVAEDTDMISSGSIAASAATDRNSEIVISLLIKRTLRRYQAQKVRRNYLKRRQNLPLGRFVQAAKTTEYERTQTSMRDGIDGELTTCDGVGGLKSASPKKPRRPGTQRRLTKKERDLEFQNYGFSSNRNERRRSSGLHLQVSTTTPSATAFSDKRAAAKIRSANPIGARTGGADNASRM